MANSISNISPVHSTHERPSALIDYIVIFNKEEDAEARLSRRFPEDDILGSALPATELIPHANDASALDPAVSFSVCDTSGNLFHCSRMAIRPESHRELEYVVIVVSRRPRYKFFQDALIGIKTLFHIGDDIEPHLEQLLFGVPAAMSDRVVKASWEGCGELNVVTPMLRCGFPEVDDYSMNLLLDSLSPELLTICVESLLKEENVVLTSHRPQFLAPCVEALRSLLYPFQWVGICSHLVPKDSITRALSRKGLPFLFGIGHLPYSTVREIFSPKHQSDPPKCFLVNLDEGKGEWVNSSSSGLSSGGHGTSTSASSSVASGSVNASIGVESLAHQVSSSLSLALHAEHRRIIADQYHAHPRPDKIRLGFLYVMLDMFHHYKQHVSSWSTSSSSKREVGFDCESFLAQTKLDNFDFVKTMLSTRSFGDFVSRVVNYTSYISSTFDRLCKAWPPTELPHAARELLMRRYGYTERGAKAVWARVRHLHNDPNLFSSKNFREFVNELGLSKDGPPSTGDPVLDEFHERQARIESFCGRESDKASPPMILPMIPRRPAQRSAVGGALNESFPPTTLNPPVGSSGASGIRLPAWIPRREDPCHFTRPCARATYFAFCRHPSDDELLTWRSLVVSKPKLHLSFAGGSAELKNALKQNPAGEGAIKLPKPVSSLTCAMKWSQLQGKRSLYDVNQVLFSLLLEERTRHRMEIRSLRDSKSAQHSNSSKMQMFGTSSSSSSSSQPGGEPEINPPPSRLRSGEFTSVVSATGTDEGDQNLVHALEARVRELEEKLRDKESEMQILSRQLRNSERFAGGVVRKSEPLFSPKNGTGGTVGGTIERPTSPASVNSSQSSTNFTSPLSTPRKYAPPMENPSMPTSQHPPAFTGTGYRVVSPLPYSSSSFPSTMTTTPPMTSKPPMPYQMGSPPALMHSKSYAYGEGIKRSSSNTEITNVFASVNHSPQPQHYVHMRGAGSPPPSVGSPPPMKKMLPPQSATPVRPMTPSQRPPMQGMTPPTTAPPVMTEEARKERNQRMWDSIEKGLDSTPFTPEEDF